MNPIERLWATYEFKPVDRLVRREFYIWDEAIERWKAQGMPADVPQAKLFGFDPPGSCGIGMLGWCEPEFVPPIREAVLQETAEYQIIRDNAGRHLKVFKGRRHGFMPTYLKHAVTNDADWDRNVLPLLSPTTPARWQGLAIEEKAAQLAAAAAEGRMITQGAIGGYMYLRSLVGPEEICYMFIDNPHLIHKMMRAWLDLAEAVTAWVQRSVGVGIDELFLAEDICYNHGLLISPDMVREFLLPYYQQLLADIRSRQPGRRLHFQVDTDGNCREAVDLYREVGMDVMSPFEVAAGNDVVAIGRKYPDLVMTGGIDKRVLAAGTGAIDEFINRVMPPMVKRGGFIPTCDHGVPDNVPYADYMHYRRRMMELDH